MPPGVLLIDSFAYKPPDDYRLTRAATDAIRNKDSPFNPGNTEAEKEEYHKETEEIHDFLERVWQKSGLSEGFTHLPPSLNPKHCGATPRTDLKAAYAECHEATCGAVEGLLYKTGLAPKDVDILISTCSIYCPTPSIASMVVNRFKMRPDIQSYHLGGMGCSTGVGAISLVRDLLKARPNCNLVLVTNEVVTPAFYAGRDKARLVPNMLFRMGAAASLFSNKSGWLWSGAAKYQLVSACRINTAARDESYKCIWWGPDDQGINGVALSKDVVTEASRALTKAMKATAPFIMTWGQIWSFIVYELKRRYAKKTGQPAPALYTPSFNKGVQHFLLHAGGAKVLDGLGKALHLSEHDLEPSRAVLYDYGNVSSSTTWYTLGYIETVRGIKAGDRVLQVGVGSGVKCAVNVWKAVRDIDDLHGAWERRIVPERRAAVSTLHASGSSGWKLASLHFGLDNFISLLLFLVVVLSAVIVALTGPPSAQQFSQKLAVIAQQIDELDWTAVTKLVARGAAVDL